MNSLTKNKQRRIGKNKPYFYDKSCILFEGSNYMSYESPIKQYIGRMQTEIENELLIKASKEVGWIIDKDELTKALLYDRDQFDKGFKEGSRARWLDCHELLPSDDRDVLIHTIFGTFEVARIDRFDANKYLWLTDEGSFSSHQVKYWMPIPELPENN